MSNPHSELRRSKPLTIKDTVCAVVGGAGFLGSHLTDYLIESRKCHVIVIDNLSAGRREFVHKQAEFIHADITHSEDFLYKLFKSHSVKAVFNYAALPYIPVSFQRPSHVLAVNTVGALNVINAAHDAGVSAILQVSSAEIYGEGKVKKTNHLEFDVGQHDPRINEENMVVPHSSYGATKAAVDYLVQCRWREAGTPCIALRQFNCVGERETHPYVVPEIIAQLDSQIVVTKRYSQEFTFYDESHPPATVQLGNNSARDFLYAGDAVRLAVELLEVGHFGQVYNLGSESSIKIYDLAKLIGETMRFKEVQVIEDPTRIRPWEIWHLQSDNRKVYDTISGRPTVGLQEALKRTVQYFRKNGRRWVWE